MNKRKQLNERTHQASKFAPATDIADLLAAVTRLVKLPRKHIWLDYDSEADVLYVHFEAEPRSTHSEMRDDGIILDYRGNRLVGLTVLDASRR